MINVSTITKALVKLLEGDVELLKEKFTIKRSEYVNYIPDLAPWIGVYKEASDAEPRSMGRHAKSWLSTIKINLLIQASDYNSGEDCEDKLDRYLELVKDAIWSDPTIGGTVEMINTMGVTYSYEYTESETTFFQWATLKITLEARTG